MWNDATPEEIVVSANSKFFIFDPSKYSLLVIDDDEDQLVMISSVLKEAGYNIVSTRSATEGLWLLTKNPFNVIISDLNMPDMSGFDFLRHIRTSPGRIEGVYIPVIMLTACDRNYEFVSLELGSDMFCEKKNIKTVLLDQLEFLLFSGLF